MAENKIHTEPQPPLEKRTWCYLQAPKVYEMAPCECGNHDTQWSELAKHLWCAKCEKDFIPKHAGIFDGAIPVKVMKMMGVSFDRIIIATREIERFDVETSKYVSDKGQTAAEWQAQQNALARTQFMAKCEMFLEAQLNTEPSALLSVDILDSGAKGYPTFQIDPQTRQIHPEMAEVMQLLEPNYERGWQMAIWFDTPNGWLEGETPLTVWSIDRAAVVAAAKAEFEMFKE